MSKKLLIHTQYFPPEIGAPQNRLFELAVRLQERGFDITVLTAMPNYPLGEVHMAYRGKKYHYEVMDGIKVHRSSIYATKSKGILKRLRNYFSFVWSSYKIGKRKLDNHYDFVLCESPPLFLAISSIRLARKKHAKFIFNVSDLWPESAEKLGIVRNRLLIKLAQYLEERTYKRADLITCQTQGILNNISGRFPSKDVFWLPNGVDLSYYTPKTPRDTSWREMNGFASDDILCLYAGIIGHAQGLEVILEAADRVNNGKLKFILMGSGPVKSELLSIKEAKGLDNVYFFDPVTKAEMPNVLESVDVSVVPLKKLDLFKGAIPSKIFESIAMKKPILLGVDGEARNLFIEEGNCGLYFEPENAIQLAEISERIASDPELIQMLGENGRVYAGKRFNRDSIAQEFSEKLNSLDLV